MTKQQVLKAIQEEIKWCEKNKEKAAGYDYAYAFIKGLRQAYYIVRELQITDKINKRKK